MTDRPLTRTNILITGASSGIGARLAEAYASPETHLTLLGRDEERLAKTAERCASLGALADTVILDFCTAPFAEAIDALDRGKAIDLAIFNAGLGGTIPADQIVDSAAQSLAVATVNFTAAVVGANIIAAGMAERKRGHIVLVGSIADTVPLPMAPTYAGTKAGLKMFSRSLRVRLEPHGVCVTLVSLGFVDTPMSRQVAAPKPFMISAEDAAARIKRQVARKRREVVLPWAYASAGAAFKLLPPVFQRQILRAMPQTMDQ